MLNNKSETPDASAQDDNAAAQRAEGAAILREIGVKVEEWPKGFRAQDPCIVAVLLATEYGKRCFPSRKINKRPHICEFQYDASANMGQILRWQQRFRPNYSVLTGRDNDLVILDFDGEQGRKRRAELEAMLGPLPQTWTCITGREEGGEHLWYRFPPGTIDLMNQQGVTVDGKQYTSFDIRSWHGYAIIPGAAHYVTGRHYRWADGCAPGECELAELPAPWFAWLPKKEQPGEAKPTGSRSSSRGPRVKRQHDPSSLLIGDGEGFGGFENPIYKNAIQYFFRAGVEAPAEPIIAALREMINDAPKGPGRDVSRYMSGSDLPRVVERARAFTQSVKESEYDGIEYD